MRIVSPALILCSPRDIRELSLGRTADSCTRNSLNRGSAVTEMTFGATKQQNCTPDADTNRVHGHVTIEGKAADIHSLQYSSAWPSVENQTQQSHYKGHHFSMKSTFG